jgi:ABC-type taurine transport system ATPase subunit
LVQIVRRRRGAAKHRRYRNKDGVEALVVLSSRLFFLKKRQSKCVKRAKMGEADRMHSGRSIRASPSDFRSTGHWEEVKGLG